MCLLNDKNNFNLKMKIFVILVLLLNEFFVDCLRLNYTVLTQLLPNIFISIKTINLYDQHIDSIDTDTFSFFILMEELDLSWNPVQANMNMAHFED